ncbi:MAG: hypothetical protein PHT12_03280 [Patescibacteria group bacterium]|nr:hypothetical protein [Patescibacteria group bacterium]
MFGFGSRETGVEKCQHGVPKGETCRECVDQKGQLLSVKEVMELETANTCPHGKNYLDCPECKKSGWQPLLHGQMPPGELDRLLKGEDKKDE